MCQASVSLLKRNLVELIIIITTLSIQFIFRNFNIYLLKLDGGRLIFYLSRNRYIFVLDLIIILFFLYLYVHKIPIKTYSAYFINIL